MAWFSFGKDKESKDSQKSAGQMVVNADSIGADGKPLEPGKDGAPVDWNTTMVVKWAGTAPKLTDRLFLSPGVSALVNWAFNDSTTGDHFGFSRIDGPFGGRFIEVCKASNPSAPSENASPASLKADIHFLSLSGTYNLRFGVGNMLVVEPELPDHPGVPTTARGEYLIGIADIDSFIRLNRLQNFNLAQLLEKVRNAIEAVVVRAITRAPIEMGISLTQLNSITLELGQRIQSLAGQELEDNFGVALKKVYLRAVEVDTTTPEYMTVFELLGSKNQKAAQMRSDSEIERLRSKLTAETRLGDIDLDKKVDMAELLSRVETAKAQDTADDILHELEKNRTVRSHSNELDDIKREIDLEKEKTVRLNELEMLKAQLNSSNRVNMSQLDQQAELAELKAKLESMKANEVVDDAQYIVDSKEKTREHSDAMQDLKRQYEMAQLAQELHLQQQRHQLELQELATHASKLQRTEAIADAGQQAEIAKMMIEIRTLNDNASIDSQIREREIDITLSDVEDLKRRQREIYQMRAQLEAQHDFSDAHGQNIEAQLGELRIKLEMQKLESDRLRMATAMQSHSAKQERIQAAPKPEGQPETSVKPEGKTDETKYSVITQDGKVNDHSLKQIVALLEMNQMPFVYKGGLPLNHPKRDINKQMLKKDPAEEG